ncbi:ABC transporter ATP-binding protein, partial [bacterium]
MPRFMIFPRFDPRLAADLRGQKRTITIGLACVLISSLLDGAIYPLIDRSISSIQEAAPRVSQQANQVQQRRETLRPRADSLATRFKIDSERVLDVLAAAAKSGEEATDRNQAIRVSREFNISQEEVFNTFEGLQNKATGDLDALRRLAGYCLGVILIFAAKYWFTRGQAFYLSRAAATLSADLRRRLFAKLQRLPVSYFGGKRVGGIQSVLTNDVG